MLDVRLLTDLLRQHYCIKNPSGQYVAWRPVSVYSAELNRSIPMDYQVCDGVKTYTFDDARKAAACFLNVIDPIRTIWGPVA